MRIIIQGKKKDKLIGYCLTCKKQCNSDCGGQCAAKCKSFK